MLPGPEVDSERYVERLSHVLRRGAYALLMPGSELSLLQISERRELVEPYVHLGLPPHDVVLHALNKPLFYDQAAVAGLPLPKSVTCLSSEEAVAAAREFAFPLVLKPTRSVRCTAGRVQQQRVQVVDEVSLLEAGIAAVGVPLTLQEDISDTTVVSCAAVRVDGQLLGLTHARYIRTYPSQRGSAALATTIAPPRSLTERVERLLSLIGWCGIFELELLERGEDQFNAIDFNPRHFGRMALAIGAGANLPALSCDHVLRRRNASPGRARVGISYRWEHADVQNSLVHLHRARLCSAAAVLRPHMRVVHTHFRIEDPAPLVARMLSMAQKASRGSIRGEAHARATGTISR